MSALREELQANRLGQINLSEELEKMKKKNIGLKATVEEMKQQTGKANTRWPTSIQSIVLAAQQSLLDISLRRRISREGRSGLGSDKDHFTRRDQRDHGRQLASL